MQLAPGHDSSPEEANIQATTGKRIEQQSRDERVV